jgi:hypothetical protein
MHTETPIQVPFGDLVVAVFDQAEALTPTIASKVAPWVVMDMLLRAHNMHALRALQPRGQAQSGPTQHRRDGS